MLLRTGADGRDRCGWCGDDPLYVEYHDREWGKPLHDERALFELLCLEGAQAGLSWITVLRKRAHYRVAYEGFHPEVVAGFGVSDRERLLADPGIVRNRAKVDAFVTNARALLDMHDRGETLDQLLWSFAPAGPHPRVQPGGPVPSTTEASVALSAALRRRGFTFVGPTITYAYMQSAGVVDDHLEGCWCAGE